MRIFNAPITRTYPGRKLIAAFAGTFAVCGIGLYYSPRAISVETSEWIDYSGALVLAFWYNHILLLCAIVLFWILLFVFNVAQPAYNAISSHREIIPHRDLENLRRFRVLARVIAVCFLGSTLLFFPIIWVRGIVFQYLLSVFAVGGFVVPLLPNFGLTARRFGDYKAFLHFDFPRCTFDVAALAPVSGHVKRALDRDQGIDIPQLLRDLELLLKVPNESIRLHTNTTSAYDHALREMSVNGFSNSPPLVLASDAEYPNISAQLEARKSKGRDKPIQLVTAQIRSLLWQSVPNERIVEEYVTTAKEHGAKIDVLALCHVHHATGRIIPVLDIVRRLEAEELWSPQEGYLLVDGAQAVGNVYVSPEIWNKCDFYAFCGHKWLLGTPTLGALYTRPHPRDRQEKWEEILLPAGLSRSCDPNEIYGSTANLESRISLQAAVKGFRTVGLERAAQWNADLANLFREKLPLAEARLSPLGGCEGGIVTVVAAKDRIQRIAAYLGDYYGKITCFDDEAVGPGSGMSALRLSFHVFHRREDIYELVQRIADGS